MEVDRGNQQFFSTSKFKANKKFFLIISVVILLIIFFVVFVLIYKLWQTKIPSSVQQTAKHLPSPTQAISKTNPFEVKTNPFKDIKTNPFD